MRAHHAKILETMRRHPMPMAAKTIARLSGTGTRYIHDILDELIETGHVQADNATPRFYSVAEKLSGRGG